MQDGPARLATLVSAGCDLRVRVLRIPWSLLTVPSTRYAVLDVLFAVESAAARTRTWGNLVSAARSETAHHNSEVLYHLSYGGSHSRVAGVI